MNKDILIIDDSWTTVVLLEFFLKENGYNPHIVLDAEKALEYLKSSIPGLILLDLQMPKITGYDFLKMINNDEHLKKIPVIIISANDTQSSIKQVKELGAIDFVPKPVMLDYLLKKIQNYI